MRIFLAAISVLFAVPAFADRRELYTLIGLGPSVVTSNSPLGNGPSGSGAAIAGEVTAYYGITNTLHVGALLRAGGTKDFIFPSASTTLDNGSMVTGNLWADTFAVGASGLVAYRVDTGYPFAPFARLELGFTHISQSRLQVIPLSNSFGVSEPSRNELVLGVRGLIGLEYRFLERFVASVGIGYRKHFSSLAQWQLEFPVSVGLVW